MVSLAGVCMADIEKDYMGKIIEYINENGLKAGDKLPSNIKLSEIFECSSSQVRTALIKLDSLGIIEIKPRSGCFVRALDLDLIVRLFSQYLHQAVEGSVPGLLFVYEVKTILDAELFLMATKTRTEFELYELNSILKKQRETINDIESFIVYDEMFHEKVAEITRNPMMAVLFKVLHAILRADRTANVDSTLEYREKVIAEHELLYQAIKEKNYEDAMLLARKHGGKRLEILLRDQ